MGALATAVRIRHDLHSRLLDARARTDEVFRVVREEAIYDRQIPVKRLNMSYVENDAVSLGNRPVVYRLFAHHAKYLIGACASVKQSIVKVMTDADCCGESSHGLLPLPLDAASARRMRQNSAPTV